MKKFASMLIGSPQQFPFEQRIFHFAMLLSIVLTAVGAAQDIYYGGNIPVDILFAGVWALVFYLSRFKGQFKAASRVGFAVFILGFLPDQWIKCNGIAGGISHYAVLFLAIVCIVLSGKQRMIMIAATWASVLLLILRDLTNISNFSIDAGPAVQLLIVMAAMVVLLIVYSNIYMKEKRQGESYAKALKQNLNQQLYYMETLEDVIGRLKSERHDYIHRLGLIYALLEDAENEKARAYASTLVGAAREYHSIVNVPYSMLRAMLNYKLSAARERGITLKLDVSLPVGLKLNEADLTVILGNLLDNAMDACGQIDKDRRYIAFTLCYKPDYLIIQVKNPVSEDAAAGGKGKTTKPDSENHGFGLRNIEYLVSKHSGIMKLAPEPGIFNISLALLVEESLEN